MFEEGMNEEGMNEEQRNSTNGQSRKLLGLERHQYIMDFMKSHKRAEVVQLSSLLKVSEVTIRKDLEKLEGEGLLLRSHGGAILKEHLLFEPSFAEKEDQWIDEKKAIAQAAVALITDGMSVAIMTGTTLSHMAMLLLEHQRLNIVTNAVNIATELMHAEGVEIFLTGGNIRRSTYALVGEIAEKSLEDIYVEIAFIGVNGFSLTHGLTTPSIEEARVVKKVMENAQKVVVAVDHTKFDEVAFYRICTVEQIHMVITDAKTPVGQIEQLREKGITVIIT